MSAPSSVAEKPINRLPWRLSALAGLALLLGGAVSGAEPLQVADFRDWVSFRGAVVEEEGPVCIGPECGDPAGAALEVTREQLHESFDLQNPHEETISREDDRSRSQGDNRLELGMETTDNVPAISDELALRLDRRSDQALRADFACSFGHRSTSRGDRRIDLDLSRTDYRRLDGYDGLVVRLSPLWKGRARGGRWRVRPWVSRMDLGNRPYLQAWGTDLAWIWQRMPLRSLEFRLQARRLDFLQGVFSPFEDRDGSEWKAGLIQWFHRPEARFWPGLIGIGVEHARREADGADYDSSSLGGFGIARFEPGPRWRLTGTTSIQRRDHRNPNHRDPLGRKRDDTLRAWSLRCEYRVSPSTGPARRLFLAWNDRWNRSNLESLFGYRSRTLAGGMLFEF